MSVAQRRRRTIPRDALPLLSKAAKLLEKTYGADGADALTTENPLAVVENRPLPYFPG